MARFIEKIEEYTLPVIAVRGAVAFPGVTLSFEIEDEQCIAAAEAAFENNVPVLVCSIPDFLSSGMNPKSLAKVGTLSNIKQSVKTPEGNMRIITEGFARATVIEFEKFANYFCASVIGKTITMKEDDSIKVQAYCRAILSKATDLAELLPSLSDDMLSAAKGIKNPALLADFIASNILVKTSDKQKVLECFDPQKRIELIIALLSEEAELLACELQIHKKVRASLNRNQKEFYMREQIRILKNELGEGEDLDEYADKIDALKASDTIKEKLFKELDRLTKMPFGSSEASVIRSYLDTCLEIPWDVTTADRIDVTAAAKILDADHDGLQKVKERILEFLAVKQLNPSLKNQILCLVGPPGVGKTSIAASIARAMKRKYVRVSLGGVRDEADIRGHRKTYIGAMPGRIVNALVEAKSKNPLMLLDEIDKLTRDSHGDPASALLEVLDGEQNHTFRDHFVEMPLDLSECMFIATANTLDTVPKPLLDRMEVIELTTYTRTEKLSIAKNHLIPKQLKRHGLNRRMLSVKDDAICEIIDFYTRESGVRSLERKIAELARKAARKLVEDKSCKSIKISALNVSDFLGARKIMPETISELDEVGVVNGLAYTSVGGDVLKVEASILDGSGKLELTGSLGDVMKESAKIAVSIVRAIAKDYGIDPDFHKNKDIHLHFPEGATPKDGPSAGVTIVTALVSALTGRAVRRDVAMTGEVSLRGRVLAIGGLKEKTMAAYAYGVCDVLIPRDNMRNLDECDSEAVANLNFIPCDTVTDVLSAALIPEFKADCIINDEIGNDFEGIFKK